jgi:hypothetical protein
MENGMAHDDVRIVAANGQEKYAQSAATDAARGSLLLTAVGMLANGDQLILGPGGYDVGTSLVGPAASNVSICGSGWGTVILGQPPVSPSLSVVFCPVGDDISIRDLAIHANGGSGIAFGKVPGTARGDRFIARAVRLSGGGSFGATIYTSPDTTPLRVSRWWDCEILHDSNVSGATSAFFAEVDRADFFSCRFNTKSTAGTAYGIRTDAQGTEVQRFYNCDVIVESTTAVITVAWSVGNGLEFYGGRLVGTPSGQPNSVACKTTKLFGTMTNLPHGEATLYYDSNIPRWRVIELVPADFQLLNGVWTSDEPTKQFDLRDGEVVLGTLVVPVEQFSGGGITDYKVSVGSTSNQQRYADLTDVDVAPGNTVFRFEDRRVLPTLGTSTQVARVYATTTGANPDQATAGKVRVHMLSVRPWPYTRLPYNPVP